MPNGGFEIIGPGGEGYVAGSWERAHEGAQSLVTTVLDADGVELGSRSQTIEAGDPDPWSWEAVVFSARDAIAVRISPTSSEDGGALARGAELVRLDPS